VAVDKAMIRRRMGDSIHEAYALCGLPLPFLWYYRGSARSVFTFRVDVDGGNAEDVRTLLREAEPYKSFMTWFVNWETYADQPRLFERALATGVVLQSHGYQHWVFPDFHHNYQNLRRAEACFASLSYHALGFAAPLCGWNRGMARAVEAVGYRYATSFGLDFDARPYFPVTDGRLGKAIQVPFHPIDLGDFLRHGYRANDPALKDYFRLLVARKHRRHEPILLYGHPEGRLGREPRVLHAIVDFVSAYDDVWKVGVDEYVEWWSRRAALSPEISFDDAANELRIVSCDPSWNPNEHRLAVREPDGRLRLLAADSGPWRSERRASRSEETGGAEEWGRVGDVLPGAAHGFRAREWGRSLRGVLSGYYHYYSAR
jgi:hypothetical protein